MLALLDMIFTHTAKTVRSFPGALPVSVEDATTARGLVHNGYVASPKANGTRCFLWVLVDHRAGSTMVFIQHRDDSVNILLDTFPATKQEEHVPPPRVRANRVLVNVTSQVVEVAAKAVATPRLDVHSTTYSTPATSKWQPSSSTANGTNVFLFDAEILPGNHVSVFDTLVYESRNFVGVCYRLRHAAAHRALSTMVSPSVAVFYKDGNTCPWSSKRAEKAALMVSPPSNPRGMLCFHDNGFFITVKPIFAIGPGIVDLDRLINSPEEDDDVEMEAAPPSLSMLAAALASLASDGGEDEEKKNEERTAPKIERPTTDGWVFTRLLNAYAPYRIDPCSVLKFKPPAHITIDLRAVHLDSLGQPTLTYTAGVDGLYTTATRGAITLACTPANCIKQHYLCRMPASKVDKEIKVDDIVEVRWDYDRGQWTYAGHRPRKKKPNAIKTCVSTIMSIKNRVGLADIVIIK